ncbi:alkyl sulfatase C-terminal domain-containing protein [Streptosporangium sp. NPDC003464]
MRAPRSHGRPSLSRPERAHSDRFRALTAEQIFDSLAIRVHGPNTWDERFIIDWHLTDLDERHRTTMSNGAMIHERTTSGDGADLRLRLTEQRLLGLLARRRRRRIDHDGDLGVLRRLTAVLEDPTPDFAIVTP